MVWIQLRTFISDHFAIYCGVLALSPTELQTMINICRWYSLKLRYKVKIYKTKTMFLGETARLHRKPKAKQNWHLWFSTIDHRTINIHYTQQHTYAIVFCILSMLCALVLFWNSKGNRKSTVDWYKTTPRLHIQCWILGACTPPSILISCISKTKSNSLLSRWTATMIHTSSSWACYSAVWWCTTAWEPLTSISLGTCSILFIRVVKGRGS